MTHAELLAVITEVCERYRCDGSCLSLRDCPCDHSDDLPAAILAALTGTEKREGGGSW